MAVLLKDTPSFIRNSIILAGLIHMYHLPDLREGIEWDEGKADLYTFGLNYDNENFKYVTIGVSSLHFPGGQSINHEIEISLSKNNVMIPHDDIHSMLTNIVLGIQQDEIILRDEEIINVEDVIPCGWNTTLLLVRQRITESGKPISWSVRDQMISLFSLIPIYAEEAEIISSIGSQEFERACTLSGIDLSNPSRLSL